MSNTSIRPRLRDWFPRLLSGQPHQIIGGQDDPYLLRWYVIPRNPLINVYLHKFLRSDDDRALHDHPWWFVSLMLKGSYTEVTDGARTRRTAPEPKRLFFGDHPVAFRQAAWRHRVELLSQRRYVNTRRPGVVAWTAAEVPCWTLIVTGRRVRTWGFWCRRLVDTWSAETLDELDTVVASTTGQVEVERFVPWTEFGDAGCGEPS